MAMVIPAPERINPFKDLPGMVGMYYNMKNDKRRTDLMEKEEERRARMDQENLGMAKTQLFDALRTNELRREESAENIKHIQEVRKYLPQQMDDAHIKALADAEESKARAQYYSMKAPIDNAQQQFEMLRKQQLYFGSNGDFMTKMADMVEGVDPVMSEMYRANAAGSYVRAMGGDALAIQTAQNSVFNPNIAKNKNQVTLLGTQIKEMSGKNKATDEYDDVGPSILYSLQAKLNADKNYVLTDMEKELSNYVSVYGKGALGDVRVKDTWLPFDEQRLDKALASGMDIDKILSNKDMYNMIMKDLKKQNTPAADNLLSIFLKFADKGVSSKKSMSERVKETTDENPDGLVW